MKTTLIAVLFLTNGLFAQKANKLSNAEKDFEKFWVTFKDNYAFFKLKGVNWDSTYKKYKPQVSRKTKEKELVSILGQMVEPLKDGHITISKGEEILFKSKRPSYFKQEFKGIENAFWQMVNETLTKNKFQQPAGVGPVFKNENLYYAARTDDVGYIRITRCFAEPESIFDDQKEMGDTKLMLQLFDSLLNGFANTKSLIIDLRSNAGGHGGIELASRFIQIKQLTHYKAIKQKGGYESYSALEPQYIEPNNGVQYLKPIIILTSDKTASSAEDFTISLYQQPHVTTIGTNTSGMLSDMFEATLSNNIRFTLSNQVYYSIDKEILEDKGVPVKMEVKNAKQDIEKKIDPVIMKALELIK
jgi:carboxyl-terminal processing protease